MVLDHWWSESRCAAEWGEVVRPDGFGVWSQGGASLQFYLEYDRSTEPLARLAGKLPGYEDMEVSVAASVWLLFHFRSTRREAGARAALAQATVPVATAAPRPTQPAHEAVWAPIGHHGARLRLIDLASHPVPAESVRRAQEGQDIRDQRERAQREWDERQRRYA